MVIHALFKALLFICAGNLINTHSHAQDLRWMGNLSESMPITSSCILIANTALCGFPFMAGFYSKDIIIEAAAFYNYNILMLILIFISVRFTSFYSIRISIITVWGPRLHKRISILDDNTTVIKSMINISLISVIIGSAIMWIIPNVHQTIILPTPLKIITIVMVVIGLLIGWVTSTTSTNKKRFISYTPLCHYASCLIWFLVPLSTQFTIKIPIYSRHLILKSVDQSWLEIAGRQGIYKNIIHRSSGIMLFSSYTPNIFLSIPVLIILIIIPILLIT